MVEPVELRTERMLLRPFREGDIDDVYAFATDREWSRYLMNVPDTYTRAHAQEFINRNLGRDWDTNPNFALVLDGRVVGSIGLVVSKEHRRAEIGYSLARELWGKGLIPEAARALVDWGFPAYELDKVFARADARNERSWRVMEKLGMTREGLLRQHRAVPGGRADEVVYGLLREEWESRAGS
jgi:ribosomal-protein-alanine N-acetyltransferase